MELAADNAEYAAMLQQLREKFTAMMRRLHVAHQGAHLEISLLGEPEAQDFITTHAGILDSSFEKTTLSDAMRTSLQRSDYIFSGIKTFHELNEASLSLIDENGNRKPFEQFLNDVRKIDEKYNKNYLRAEYNFCQQSANMASKWEEFLKDGDRYNLQYRTAGDDHVRPAHAALHGITLPPSHPFWQRYFPPNGWNCRCTVVQVRKSKYPQTPDSEVEHLIEKNDSQNPKEAMFRFNPGMEQKTVPDYNAYTIRRCQDCPVAKGKSPSDPLNLSRPSIPNNELCQACQFIRQLKHNEAMRPLSSEERKTIRLAADKWASIHLEKTVNEFGQKCNRLMLNHERIQQGVILDKDFFDETFSKSNKKRNRLLAQTMELATKITEWFPNAKYVRTEGGRHHPYPFDVFETIAEGREIEFKVAMKHSGPKAYTMRIKNENRTHPNGNKARYE